MKGDLGAAAGAPLEVAVQKSRFHLETLEGSATGDVDVRGLSITIAKKELLQDAHLALRRGVRYGLVGRNGCGKTSLLRALASRAVPHGLPRDMRVLYVQQENVPGDERSALQTVVDCASARSRLEAQVAELEAALESEADDPAPLVACVQALTAGKARQGAADAEKIAAARSRARGKEALRALQAAQQQAQEAEAQQLTPEAASGLAPQLLSELYEALEGLGASAEEEQLAAAGVLAGLGFGEGQMAAPTSSLSGGWRMRVALGAALLAQPQLLLLDEPTNHLDIMSILWLQDYLTQRCEGQTVVVVSHDRSFLNAVAQETVVMREGRLEYFPGTYDAYVQARAEANLSKERQVAQQEKQKAALMDTIARCERAAREAGDDKKLGQAASRRKKIDRLGCERTEDGKAFRRSYWAGYHDTQRPQVQLDKPEEPVVLQLPPPEPLRQLGPLLQLQEVGVAYAAPCDKDKEGAVAGAVAAAPRQQQQRQQQREEPPLVPAGGKGGKVAAAGSGGRKAPAAAAMPAAAGAVAPAPARQWVLQGATFDVEQRARIGLVGLNGSGKSSLMRVLAGLMPPACGSVTSPCPRLLVGHVDQHSGSALLREPGVSGTTTAFQLLQARAPTMRDQDVYDYLGKFAVPGGMAAQPLNSLSGGQLRRVALAATLLARPHLLLLDEPTNHLDLLTVQALASALNAWEGAAIIASHDMSFLRDTCTEVRLVEGGAVQRLPQPDVAEALAAYTQRLTQKLKRKQAPARKAPAAAPPPGTGMAAGGGSKANAAAKASGKAIGGGRAQR